MKVRFDSHSNKTHFHVKVWALGIALIMQQSANLNIIVSFKRSKSSPWEGEGGAYKSDGSDRCTFKIQSYSDTF